jgi:hypothetical protein
MMSCNPTDSDNEDDELTIPKGVLRSKGGWEGDELEWERSRSTIIDPKASAAVDLTQFQNEEVGKGYQAKHVLRQPTITKDQKIKFEDMTTAVPKKSTINTSQKRKNKHDEQIKSDQHQHVQLNVKLAKYLSCEAFCKFRQEIEKMV